MYDVGRIPLVPDMLLSSRRHFREAVLEDPRPRSAYIHWSERVVEKYYEKSIGVKTGSLPRSTGAKFYRCGPEHRQAMAEVHISYYSESDTTV